VTHDQVEALTLGDRVGVMGAGTVEQVGTPDEVYRRPANRFVATFVGSPKMNVVAAGAIPVDLPRDVEIDAVELGIRPEHLVLGAGDDGLVRIVEYAGPSTYVHVEVGAHVVVARTDPGTRPQVGDRVAVTAQPEHVYLFDGATGETIRQAEGA
ncbi:MAG TPA: TOBE domain-containing protein, partial [Acidimicrobiales bacterium]|nr:TOBE domain-containing protein [Acidimicrobiales bacterium]